MSTEIFQNAYKTSETWSASGALITFKSNTGNDIEYNLLMEGIQCGFQRRIQDLFPLASSKSGKLKKISLVGAPTGGLTCSGVLGPKTSIKELLLATGKACYTDTDTGCSCIIRPFTNTCTEDGSSFKASDSGTGYKLTGLILASLAVTIQGGEMAYIRQPLSFTFTNMELL